MSAFTWARRIAARALTAAAMGVVTTLGAAWLIAATAPPSGSGVQVGDIVVRSPVSDEFVRVTDERRSLGAHTRRAWIVRPIYLTAHRAIDERYVESSPWWLDHDLRLSNMIEEHVGWPAPALRAGWRGGVRGEWPCLRLRSGKDQRLIPLVPLPGFFVNTAFFGITFLAVAWGARRIAAVARRHAGPPALDRLADTWMWFRRVSACVALGLLVTVAAAWWISIRAAASGAGPGGVGMATAVTGQFVFSAGRGGSLIVGSGAAPAAPTGPSAITTQTRYADAAQGNEYIVDETRGRGWRWTTVTCLAGGAPARASRNPWGTIAPTPSPTTSDLPRAPRWMVNAVPPSTAWNEAAYGWPLKTLGIVGEASRTGSELTPTLSLVADSVAYPLPIRPRWGALSVNVAAIGGVFGAAMLLTGFWRGRVRPGRCAKCGYDLRGLPEASVCPECGAAQKASVA